jgi:hypothetical protein
LVNTYFFVIGAVFGAALLMSIDRLYFNPQRMRWEREVVEFLCTISQAVRSSMQGDLTKPTANIDYTEALESELKRNRLSDHIDLEDADIHELATRLNAAVNNPNCV